MKKILIISLLVSQLAFADEWDKRFEDLCSYDTKYCGNLKDSNGEWKKPAKEMVMALKTLSDVINKASSDFGVDARAIVGCVLAENSLNVSVSDSIQDWLVKTKIAGKGSVLGKSFSFGWGQLYMEAALEAEPLMAKIEGRKVRSADEIAQALLRPEDAIRYVAAVVRKIQDDYKSQGIDISSRPEILATVYNLGQSLNRAKSLKASGKAPRVNNFGFFVEKYLDVISAIVDKDVSKRKLKNQDDWDYLKPKGLFANFIADKRKKEKGRRATADLKLIHAPPSCYNNSNDGDKEYVKNLTLNFTAPSGLLKREAGFRIITKSLDCDLNEWRLIEDESGEIKGWISLEVLENNSRPSEILQACRIKANWTSLCIEHLQSLDGFEIIENNDGKLFVKLVGRKNVVNWKMPYTNDQCAKVDKQVKKPEVLTSIEIVKLKQGIKDFKSSVLRKLQIDPNLQEYETNTMNPYRFVYDVLNFDGLSHCAVEYDKTKFQDKCSGNVDSFLKRLNNLEIKKYPKWKDLTKVKEEVDQLKGEVFVVAREYNDESLNLENIKIIKDNIALCKMKFSNYPNALKYILELEKQVNDTSNHHIFIGEEYNFVMMKELCENFEKAFKTSDEDLKNCFSCDLRFYIGKQSISGVNIFSYEIIRQMLKTDEEKDEFLLDQFKNLTFEISKGISQKVVTDVDPAHCSYDQKQTSDLIEKILANSCVQEVYVPDTWIINQLYRSGKERLPIIKTFIEDDRFEIDLKERQICSE